MGIFGDLTGFLCTLNFSASCENSMAINSEFDTEDIDYSMFWTHNLMICTGQQSNNNNNNNNNNNSNNSEWDGERQREGRRTRERKERTPKW